MINDHRTDKRFLVESSPGSNCFLCYDNKCLLGVVHISQRRTTRVYHYKGNAETALKRVQRQFPRAVVVEFKATNSEITIDRV